MKSVIFAAFAAAFLATSAQAQDKVSVQLDWIVRGDHAMFFVAKEKGYFAKQGIDVTEIRRGTGTPNALRLVGDGDADFGFGDLPTLAVARSQDVPVGRVGGGKPAQPACHDDARHQIQAEKAAGPQGPQRRRAARGLDLRVSQGVSECERNDTR